MSHSVFVPLSYQPQVDALYTLDQDELQEIIDPLKRDRDTVQGEARSFMDRVRRTRTLIFFKRLTTF